MLLSVAIAYPSLLLSQVTSLDFEDLSQGQLVNYPALGVSCDVCVAFSYQPLAHSGKISLALPDYAIFRFAKPQTSFSVWALSNKPGSLTYTTTIAAFSGDNFDGTVVASAAVEVRPVSIRRYRLPLPNRLGPSMSLTSRAVLF